MADETKKDAAAAKEEPKKEAPKDGKDAKEGEGAEGAPASGGLFADKKKLMMLGGAAVALLMIVGGAVWFFVLRQPASPEGGGEAEAVMHGGGEGGGAQAGGPSVFFDVPEFSLNLAASGQQEHFLRLKVTLEFASAEEQAQAQLNVARLQDDYVQYLRQLRLDDLRGNAGLQRMKEDLLLRASQTLAPVRVKNVLFREVLVQ